MVIFCTFLKKIWFVLITFYFVVQLVCVAKVVLIFSTWVVFFYLKIILIVFLIAILMVFFFDDDVVYLPKAPICVSHYRNFMLLAVKHPLFGKLYIIISTITSALAL